MIPFMLNRNNEAPAVLIIIKAKYTIRHSSNFVYSNLNPFVTHIFIKVKKTVIKANPPKVSEELNKDIRSRAQIDINMNLSKNCKIKLLPVNGANTFWIRLRSVLIIINKNYFSIFSIYISDTVSAEVKITDLVTFYSLQESAENWAKNILDTINTKKRSNMQFQIIEAGYDIVNTAKILEQYYKEWNTMK